MAEQGKNLLILKCQMTIFKRDAYIGNEMQLQNLSLVFIPKNKSLLSATSVLSRSSLAHNTTASLDKLILRNMWTLANAKTDLVEFIGPKIFPNTWM